MTKLSLLGPELGSRVGDLNTQNLSPSDDLDPLLAAHAVGNGSGVLARVHEQKLELGKVVDEELLVAGGEEVTGLLVGTVTNLGHRNLALEPSSNPVVNTLGLPPALLDTVVPVRLVPLEVLCALLDNGDVGGHF